MAMPADGPTLGATVDGDATRFEVWAPAAAHVEVEVTTADDTSSGITLDRIEARLGMSTWTATVDGVGHGDRYRYRLDGGDWLPDPASRWQPDGVHGPSAVVDPARFAWTDAAWAGVTLADTVLYELHVGTFTDEGTFDAAIGQLPRLARLGITTIELMPVNAFPGSRNWGYDGVFPSAVQASYGGPDGLARFVDAAHAHGLGVVVDVVYNHFGPEGNVAERFGPYVTDAHRTPWGAAVNVAEAGSDAVRRLFIESALGWVRDFHVDGLRLDAVHALVDPTPVPFVQQLTRAVHAEASRRGRPALVTIESSANDPRIVRDEDDHGWGCDAVWNDDVHHALRVALTGERHEYYRAYRGVADLALAWEHRWVYSGRYSPTFDRQHGAPADDVPRARFIVFDTNHDHIGNTPAGARLLADADADDPRHRLAAATILLSPFTPMIFMGEEYGETAPFPYFVDHGDRALLDAVREGRQREFSGVDWSGEVADPADPGTFWSAVLDPHRAERAPHSSVLAMYTELLRVRRATPALTDPTATQVVELDDGVLRVQREHEGTTATLTLNFTPEPVPHLPEGDLGFDSADELWGGPGTDRYVLGAWAARLEVSGD